MSVFFNGRMLTTPAVASQIDDRGMANRSLATSFKMAIIGRATSGQPKVVHELAGPTGARELFKGGELLKAIELAFAGSPETYAPQSILAIRADDAVPARLVLPTAAAATTGAAQADGAATDYTIKLASGAAAVDDTYNGYAITLASGESNLIEDYNGTSKVATCRYPWKTRPGAGVNYSLAPAALALVSKDYGLEANRIKVKVEAGTLTGKKVQTGYGQEVVVKDDVAAVYFTLKYIGSDASALATVTGTSLVIETGGVGSETAYLTADLTTYDTVAKLVDYLDADPNLECAGTSAYLEKSVVNALDFAEEVDIKEVTAVNFTANLQALVDYFNSAAEPYVDAYRPPQAGAVPANIALTFLAGANVANTVDTTDYQACFDLLKVEDVQVIVPLSSNSSIHAMALAHCDFMSDTAAKERRCVVGGATGETKDEVLARALALNSDRCYLVTPGIKSYNDAGVLTTYAPYMAAALVGGMCAGSDPGTSLTNKVISVAGLEKRYIVPTETDVLIEGGVIALIPSAQGYRVAKSVSTWLKNDNYNRVEMGTGFAVDYISRTARAAVEDLKGRKGTRETLALAASRVESALKELARPAPLGPEVIVGDEENPPYRNISATLEGDVIRVYFEASPVVPVNYVLIGIGISPYSGTVSL